MFQNFESHASPAQGPARLASLRGALASRGLAGFMVPRADAHQGEYVAPHDERLQWLTGFTGSAGFCIVLPDIAGVFIDGRYRTQVKGQVDPAAFTPVPWPDVLPGAWLREHLAAGEVGFDPWLHSKAEIERLREALAGSAITLAPVGNPLDAIWTDQPVPPAGRVFVHPDALAGESHRDKRHRLGAALTEAGEAAAVITLADSLAWLLNIRGADVARNPVVHGFAILHADGRLDLFTDPAKFDDRVRAHLGDEVTLASLSAFLPALAALTAPVRVDAGTVPLAVSLALDSAGVAVSPGDDPCRLPKARKNTAELAGMREAHLRDGAAVAAFLCWLDGQRPEDLTEITVVEALEGFRHDTGRLHDLSFDTICGSGPNGAIMHYRVTRDSNRRLQAGELVLVDSGAQYTDGTTDITRTMALGIPAPGMRETYTRVLRGLIAVSRLRWPRGLAGRDLDPIARYPLWVAGRDFDHGTGHGVGAFLSVHEGPQRLSRLSEVPIEPGMILSNEPGCYQEGAFGIRLENLIAVEVAPPMGDNRDQLAFETLTFAPFDRRLIDVGQLSPGERAWLDSYHREVQERIGPRVSEDVLVWLREACAPL